VDLTKQVLIGLAASILITGAAWATPTTFVDEITSINEYVRPCAPYCYTHDITDDVPADAQICNATLSVWISDDCRDLCCFPCEVSVVIAEGGSWDIGFPDVGTIDIDVAALDDGFLNVCVLSIWGDFVVRESTLSGTYGPCKPVPEPATAVLFAMGIISTAAGRVRRKQ